MENAHKGGLTSWNFVRGHPNNPDKSNFVIFVPDVTMKCLEF